MGAKCPCCGGSTTRKHVAMVGYQDICENKGELKRLRTRIQELEERVGLKGETIPECLEGRFEALNNRTTAWAAVSQENSRRLEKLESATDPDHDLHLDVQAREEEKLVHEQLLSILNHARNILALDAVNHALIKRLNWAIEEIKKLSEPEEVGR